MSPGPGDATWRTDARWSAAGHRLAPSVRAALGVDGHAILSIADAEDDYVTVHGHLDLGWYAEARSGECDGPALSPLQRRRLDELGWRSPRDHECAPDPGNLWIRRDGPVALYPLLVLLLGTLAEVYCSRPDELRTIRGECDCYEWVDDEHDGTAASP